MNPTGKNGRLSVTPNDFFEGFSLNFRMLRKRKYCLGKVVISFHHAPACHPGTTKMASTPSGFSGTSLRNIICPLYEMACTIVENFLQN